jgi:acyl-CoA thioester hydrolase
MPLTHNRSFRIRQYECDANGHLNNASYLRYMQETAFDASAAAGYDIAAYEKLNSIWLIRETGIEYFHPVTYGDNIVVKTWVEDFRKVSSRRVYEFHNPQSEQLVARAHTDWAYIDVQSNRPAKIPPQMTSSFYPEGLPEIFPQRKPFPPPPPPPDDVFSMNLTVKWHDIDVMEHVNNATYIDYMNACTM